jgi:glycosyltransferase involved in cell wall biosynthesis
VNPRASVVVPVYNGERTLPACLEALKRQSLPPDEFEVIVVDDGSTDGTAGVAERFGVVYLHQENQGPATARNRGAEQARGEFLLFTDADCEPHEDWLEEMLRCFEDPEVAGAKGVYENGGTGIWTRFAQVEFEERYALLAKHDSIDMVDTYSAAFRRSRFIDAGGFDSAFPEANNEDTEISYRLAEAGHRLVFAPGACVRHLGHPASFRRYARLKFGRGFWRTVVYRRFPGKMMQDSYTPQLLKVQVLLAGLFGLGALLWAIGLGPLALAIVALLWVVSVAPFVSFALPRDPLVGLLSPWFLLVRAMALGLGTFWSIVHPPPASRDGGARGDAESRDGESPGKRVQMLYSLGYMESRVYKVAQALIERGWRVDLLIWDRDQSFPAREVVDGIHVERIQFPGGTNAGPGLGQKLRFVRFYLAAWRRLRKEKIDVMHCVNLDSLLFGSLIAFLHRVPVVYDAHEPNYYAYWGGWHAPLRGLLRFLEVRLSRRAALVIVTSEFQLRKYRDFGASEVLLLPNHAERRMMNDLGADTPPDAPLVFGRIGSIYADTGVIELVHAFARVKERFPEIRLKLAGRLHTPYVPVMEELLSEGREEGVELQGEYDYNDIEKVYVGIDIALLPYRLSDWFKEISPVKFFESMSFGVPVVATDIGGIGEVIEQDEIGIVLREGSIDELEHIMQDLCERPEHAREMGRRAFETMRTKYYWEKALPGLDGTYPQPRRARRETPKELPGASTSSPGGTP